jgi:hypothetical protein
VQSRGCVLCKAKLKIAYLGGGLMNFSAVYYTVAIGAATATYAQAQDLQPPAAVAPAMAVAGTVVNLRITQPLSSRLSKPGERFSFVVSEPVVVNGLVAVPAGTVGEGEVIHSAKPNAGGKAGELILSARFLVLGDHKTPLRGMQIFKSGKNNENAAMAVSAGFGVLGLLVQGGDVIVPDGASATAKLAEDVPAIGAATPSVENGAT